MSVAHQCPFGRCSVFFQYFFQYCDFLLSQALHSQAGTLRRFDLVVRQVNEFKRIRRILWTTVQEIQATRRHRTPLHRHLLVASDGVIQPKKTLTIGQIDQFHQLHFIYGAEMLSEIRHHGDRFLRTKLKADWREMARHIGIVRLAMNEVNFAPRPQHKERVSP